jgi:predicted RNase H-like nuclease
MRVVGVDGCPGGWVAVAWDVERRTLSPSIHWHISDLLAAHQDADKIGIDIPIGLAVGVPRRCDIEARKVLGPRKSSVFPAPDPRLLDCPSYADARLRSVSLCGKSVSAQAYAIYSKVKQVNDVMTPQLQDFMFELHPEVSFWAMANEQPMQWWKKLPPGFEERRALLTDTFKLPIPTFEEARSWVRPAGADDILDAIAAAWTAKRVAEGRGGRLPPDSEFDARGLRMEIVY